MDIVKKQFQCNRMWSTKVKKAIVGLKSVEVGNTKD